MVRVVNQTGDRVGSASELNNGQAIESNAPLMPISGLGIANIANGLFYNQAGESIGNITELSEEEFDQAAAAATTSSGARSIDLLPVSNTAGVSTPESNSSPGDSTVPPIDASTTVNPDDTTEPEEKNNGGNNNGGGCGGGGGIMRFLRGLMGVGMIGALFAGVARGGVGGLMMLPYMMTILPRMFMMFR